MLTEACGACGEVLVVSAISLSVTRSDLGVKTGTRSDTSAKCFQTYGVHYSLHATLVPFVVFSWSLIERLDAEAVTPDLTSG